MSTAMKLDAAALTEVLSEDPCPDCWATGHRWGPRITEYLDEIAVTRQRCTCNRCACDGLQVTVAPPDTGTPQHRA